MPACAASWPHRPSPPSRPQDTRTAGLATLGDLRSKKRRLLDQLEEQKANDPATIAELREKVGKAKEAANRWVDNLWALKSHCVKKLSMVSSDFDRLMQVPADLDYFE